MSARNKHKVSHRYLTLKHNIWYFHKAIPKDQQDHYGKQNYVVNLKTSDIREARCRRDELSIVFDREIKHLREGGYPQGSNASCELKDLIAYAMESYTETLKEDGLDSLGRLNLDEDGWDHISNCTDVVEEVAGAEGVRIFNSIATGQDFPIEHLTEEWLSEVALDERTIEQYRSIVKQFIELTSHKMIGEVSRQIVHDYIKDLKKTGIEAKTINKKLSAVRSYWKWLRKRGYAKENPFLEQNISNKKQKKADLKQPWDDKEVTRLIENAPDEFMKDMMLIAIYSGMRISEICELKIENCQENIFNIVDSKTDAGIRKVPIHSRLRNLVDKRCLHKQGDSYLFHELDSGNRNSRVKRSDRVSKRFGRFHRSLFGDMRQEGQRQSPKDFHSFRRWFITKAECAGEFPWIIASVVGHTREGMTMGVYSSGPSLDQKRACVESVKLDV